MAQIETSVSRDEYGTPNGGSVAIKNDQWTAGGEAKSTEGNVYINNDSFKTQINYDKTGILGTISATTKVGPFTFSGSVNTDGTMTGSGEAKFAGGKLTVTPDMASYGFKHPVGTGELTGRLTTTNEWSLGFTDSIGSHANYGFSSGYSSSNGFSFYANIFSIGG